MNQEIIGRGKIIFDPKDVTKKHQKQSGWKKTAMIIVNDDTAAYYKWLIERRFFLSQGVLGKTEWINTPLRGTHVTIINDRFKNEEAWEALKKKWHGTEIEFTFNWDDLRFGNKHWIFKVRCPMGQAIRDEIELGYPYFSFHLTIGMITEESMTKFNHMKHIFEYNKRYGYWIHGNNELDKINPVVKEENQKRKRKRFKIKKDETEN